MSMSRYQVLLDVSNYVVRIGEQEFRAGFLTFRYVEAGSSEGAEAAAVLLLKQEPDLQRISWNAPDDPPLIQATKIEPVEAGQTMIPPGKIWYGLGSPRRWWQFWRFIGPAGYEISPDSFAPNPEWKAADQRHSAERSSH